MFKRKPIVMAIALSLAQSAHADLTSGLVAYYPFNGNALDASGNGNNGTVYGATLTADRFGNANSAYSFNGVNNTIHANIYQDTGSGDVTISAWVKPGSQQYGMDSGVYFGAIAGKGFLDRTTGYGLYVANDKPEFQARILNNVQWAPSSNTINDNEWHHLVGTLHRNDVNGIAVYVDSIDQGRYGDSTSLTQSLENDYPFSIGTRNTAGYDWGYFNGLIDDVRLYNRALTAFEIQELYQQGTTHQLTITKTGTGNGSVTSNPTGINCAAQVCIAVYPPPEGCQCSAAFPLNTNVTLTATAASDSTFNGFSGAADCNDGQVSLNADTTCTATFALAPKAPTVVTNAASNIAATSATLNGNVNSNGATASVSFDLGPSTSYGTSIAATPAQVYSATPIAVSAVKTGLSCSTTYHYRAKAVNSVGTGLGADTTFTTAATGCNPNAWIYPPAPTVSVGKPLNLDLHVNSGGATVGAYDFTLTFDPSKLVVDTTQCDQGVCAGANALASRAVLTNNDTGNIRLVGLDTVGTGPGNDLQLLIIRFLSRNSIGNTSVGLNTTRLVDPLGGNIGTVAKGANVTIQLVCGDADGSGITNIVDALAIARYLVGMPPPPTVNVASAEVDDDGALSIVDALHIARYAVGLLVVGTCLQ